MVSFDGLIAVVIGAGTPLGHSICLSLVKEGCSLAICDENEEALVQTKANCDKMIQNREISVLAETFDVSDIEQVKAFGDIVQSSFNNRVDILINAQGSCASGSFLESLDKESDQVAKSVFLGCVNVTQCFLPMLINGNEGFICNVCSISAVSAARSANSAICNAAQAAKMMFTQSLYKESLGLFPNVRVSYALVAPIEGHGSNSVSVYSPEKAASKILHKLKKGRARIVVGDEAFVTDLVARTFPQTVYNERFSKIVLEPWATAAGVCEKFVAPKMGILVVPVVASIIVSSVTSIVKNVFFSKL